MPSDLLLALVDVPRLDPVGLRLHGPNPDLDGTLDNGICTATDVRSGEDLAEEEPGPVDDVLVAFDVAVPTWCPRTTCSVDLADPATRDRVARWAFEEATSRNQTCIAPSWRWLAASLTWGFALPSGDIVWRMPRDLWRPGEPVDQLDVASRLPDGSRRADARALLLAAQHVGGAR